MKSIEKLLSEMKKIDTSGQLITEETIKEIIEVFNAAVEIKAGELKNQLKDEMTTEAEELKDEMTTEAEELRDEIITEAEEYKNKLINTIDVFFDETVNGFYENYKDSIEDDIKLVFYEDFFNHVKYGFEKHNFTLDENDIDVIKSLKKELDEKDETINEKINEIYELREAVLQEEAKCLLIEKTQNMTESEKCKLYSLLEDVEFNSVNEAENKIDLFITKFNDVEIDNDEYDDNNNFYLKEKHHNDNIVQEWLENM